MHWKALPFFITVHVTGKPIRFNLSSNSKACMLSETESLKHLIPFIVQESGDHWNPPRWFGAFWSRRSILTKWSGDVIRRTGMKNFNAVSHNRARPYFRIQHVRGEFRTRRVYLNVHSVTGNVVGTEWSVEFWRWKCCRELGNNSWGRARLWDTVLKFFFPVLQITSPDHLEDFWTVFLPLYI